MLSRVQRPEADRDQALACMRTGIPSGVIRAGPHVSQDLQGKRLSSASKWLVPVAPRLQGKLKSGEKHY